MAITEHLQLVIIELKRQKKSESFPDGVYGQANRIMCDVGDISYCVRCIKTFDSKDDSMDIQDFKLQLKQSLISTMATCLRMLEEMEK